MLTFWELSPSPNNTKIRMALRYKGIEFEARSVDPVDRQAVLEVSGQELTPVIEDRGIVLNDSEAILQYLDANYPDAPRLLPRTRAGRRECDEWKKRLDEQVAAHWLPVFMYGIRRVDTLDEEARLAFRDALARLDKEIGDRDSFKNDPEMAVCDIRAAEWATYAFPGEGLVRRVRLFESFRELFGMKKGSLPNLERFLGPWNERLA
jgi:glutathione S-transferase